MLTIAAACVIIMFGPPALYRAGVALFALRHAIAWLFGALLLLVACLPVYVALDNQAHDRRVGPAELAATRAACLRVYALPSLTQAPWCR